MQQVFPGFEGVRGSWDEEDVLVTVKAYPNPSEKYRETSCVAGIRLRDQKWIRIHPVPFRLLPGDQRFRKFTIIKATVSRSNDPRVESHRYFLDKDIQHVRRIEPTKAGWRERNQILMPLRSSNAEELSASDPYEISLGLVRVRSIDQLILEPQQDGWTPAQQRKLMRLSRFPQSVPQLERPPYEVYYRWHCDNPDCRGHRMKVLDWEVLESVRRWAKEYDDDFEVKFREKYEDFMSNRDLHFFLGTMLRWPKNWTIVGLYYPPAGV